jgi:Tol biopolymer transport system component
MKKETSMSLLASLLLAFASAPAPLAAQQAASPAAQQAANDMVPVPATIAARNVPQIPRERVEDLLPYENIRSAAPGDWHPTERKMYIRTRFAQSLQLHEVAMPMGARTQLTFFNDPVMTVSSRPGNPDQAVFSVNENGAENFQLYLLDRKNGRSRRFTDGKSRYQSALWSRDGKLLAYHSNARNGRDSDLYVADPATPGSERLVAQLEGGWGALDWSPDNKRILLGEGISANESYLHWVDVATGKVTAITPRLAKDAEPAVYGGGRWTSDGKAIFTTTDREGEFRRLVRLGLDNSIQTVYSKDISWDVDGFDLSDDGKILAFFTNEDGFSKLRLVDAQSGAALPSPELPPSSSGGIRFRPNSREVGFSLNWARSPSDIYSYDVDSRKLERWTASEVGGLNTEQFVVPTLVRYPTFDEEAPGKKRTIPAFVYRAPADRFKGPRPVYRLPGQQQLHHQRARRDPHRPERPRIQRLRQDLPQAGRLEEAGGFGQGHRRAARLDQDAAGPRLLADHGQRWLLRRLHGARLAGALWRPALLRLRIGRRQQLRDLPQEHQRVPPRPAPRRVR